MSRSNQEQAWSLPAVDGSGGQESRVISQTIGNDPWIGRTTQRTHTTHAPWKGTAQFLSPGRWSADRPLSVEGGHLPFCCSSSTSSTNNLSLSPITPFPSAITTSLFLRLDFLLPT